ncbi:non-ribosomal peptide synthetase [Mycobacterium nebraskense]|uniref:Non-ribosomal peptide synthetase n=1 Tax=Mycobacterium nebraskense TaxID=244292 RepID=A0A0F5NBD6_9MYCO|nr:non-ribosomal peptide synthetase [Mycobacterium nebraskense]KKC04165.1 amino acid adenylation protein [Mycobacterium nebraskense]KLO42744.1 amino acid adenylation protein [Mycobacterium nebraskense]MBI2696454.1 non-ribosomal peptide synthetase [Mycobacterium nebraskense]MCV7120472.1 non-ribosomal peptide synthetase [Mycobacterium nebraskense]ORW31377.1 non-ribosomal peptide synthetase [Mycobacterium nebraskense]
MADDAETLQERRLELLRRRIAEKGLAAGKMADEARICAGERYRLSVGQRRMWFLQTMAPADTTLNICVAYRLTGALDGARLRSAFNDVVARHAVLRTTYGVDSEGEPYQVFHDGVENSWRTDDLTHLTDEERERQIQALTRDEFGRPFDLTSEPPLRINLIRIGTEESVLLLVAHHICWDDDSWAVFFRELSAAYNGRQLGRPAPQFVAVEVLETSEEPSTADIGYWVDTLRPLPEPLELPGAGAAHPSRRAERQTRALPADLFNRVENFARKRSASPFMVLLAGFGVLVRRYTGAADFLVSIPVTDRRAAAEGAIGYFGNTLLLRIGARAHDTFTSLVDSVRETCLGGFAHKSVGIDRVVREINPERMGHDGMDGLVRVGFSMRKSASGFALDGVAVRQLELGAVAAPLPLALAVVLDPDGAFVEVEYQADVLSSALIEQMVVHYLQLLDNALAEPERRVTRLDILGPEERNTVLARSHGELVDTPATTMVAILEAAATAALDAVALSSDEVDLSYAELHRRANRLARWLIQQGFGADDIIGLRIAASIEFVVALLAVLKAGAAYLPIDPAYPAERIDYLVTDARPRTVIGPQELEAAGRAAAQLSDVTVTEADRLYPLLPDHLAYVIYTSGSTGQPKGVAVSHRAIAEHVEGFIAEWCLTAEDRWLQSSSVSFDASLADIFLTLSLGAQLIVPNPAKSRAFGDVDYVADLISRRGVTVLHMVPSMLSTLLMLPQAKQWRTLRHVPVGGEALPGEIADEFVSCFDAQLRNHYGPTEAVVCSTHHLVEGSHGMRVVPIGTPNRNVYAYVLDEELQPVPAEVIGELYLGGAQLARGYLGRPGLTAQRFIADPFNPGMRLYRSGDLVRRNITGALEFVGRADEQVKIRGFRIELGEVRSVIATHPAVRQCLVVADNTEAGPTLVAYLVPLDDSAHLDLEGIRAHTASVLPEYTVPNAFAVIPEIPLTVSGKLDKRALPAPTPTALRSYRAPATITERRMCSIFTRLFGWERVGAEDSFFSLGGHSLLAARLVAQIRAEFGVELTIRTVFDAPTPAGLAAQLVDQFRAEFDIDLDEMEAEQPFDEAMPAQSPRPALVESVRPERLPLSYSQLAAWFQYRIEGARDGFNMPFALRFEGPLDPAALTEALNDVVARHEPLRTNFIEYLGVPYQIVHPELEVDLPISRITADRFDETVAELRRHVLTPERGPLIRANLLALESDRHVLFLIVHHIVSDHASLGVLSEDLIVAYRARLRGEPPQWAALPVQFADYALWQRDAFDKSSGWGRDELAYWRDALAGLPDVISVAADHSRPPALGKRGEVASFTVSAARRAALTRLGEQNGATEFMVYQAVLATLLHKLGGGTDIVIGSPVASRVESATAHLIGLFANVVVLRNDLSGDPRLRTIVAHSRDTVLDAFAHQELPIERLVEALNPPRSRSWNPLFQTLIHFRGEDWALTPRDLTGTGETTVCPLSMDFDVSLLDLDIGINVTEGGELDVRIVANADLYEPHSVALIADALNTALDAFATTPDRPVSMLELLPTAAMEKLLAPPTPAVVEPSQPVTRGSAETEQLLIALLEELLDITGVDPEDNFFALGGDSIISIKWSAQATERGLTLTPAMVFEHMTIAELAAAVDTAADQPVAEAEPAAGHEYTPMSASGLSPEALAELTASWLKES